ncbi:endoribonuclease Dicer [Aricia agestis]|uniref:endoribonuclease Dicer n=1 Tax=Aricia agestis TaxID=91739 RepID=UPI001C20876C|nr:endoribonuclease Dicer [Aricia agestis]XP_041980154.1 endoribonuclease Dicer [Aricia agestis]XP_041980155.1 endoribonuclease Dicer [Aricia agestis]
MENKEDKIIPRAYQVQLEEIAYSKNTLIHLPTGSGKTLIATQLIKRFKEPNPKPWGQGGKRCFFLVNTVPLVRQQKKVIELRCPVNGVGCYSGEDGVDFWDKRKWDSELSKHEVIVMTTQILSDMLTHNYIKIENINLIIFDECHHAVEDHPMRAVMKHFEHCPPDKHPRVLGLTATLLNANIKYSKVEDTLKTLEKTFQATIATVNEMGEVLTYSTNPKEYIQYYLPPALSNDAHSAIGLLTELQKLIMSVQLPPTLKIMDIKLKPGQKDISRDSMKTVKSVKNLMASAITAIQTMGAYGGNLSILAYMILLERLKRKAQTKEEELLYSFTLTRCIEARTVLVKSMKKYEGYERIVKFSSEKVLKLLNILREYNPEVYNKRGVPLVVNQSRKPLCGIIFTQERFTSKILYNLLKSVKEANPAEFGFLKHDFIVGFNTNPFNNTRESHYAKKLSCQALLKFKNGDLNCLISTSVIEEGIDVPQCLLVLRYDEPKEYRSYIQSKGRARSSESSFVMLVDAGDRGKFSARYSEFQQIERYISKILVGNTLERDAPTEEDIQKDLYEEEIPPYVTKYGVRLSAGSAISLLNRYCSVLPHDLFTAITPMWIQERPQNSELRRTIIILPLACPVKEDIVGDYFEVLKNAKRSAALKACMKLHEVGELDEVTLLPRKYGKVDFDQVDVKACFPNWPWDQENDETDDNLPKTGTKHRIRKYNRHYPVVLNGPSIYDEFDSKPLYLHVIELKVAYDEPKDSRENVIYNLLRNDQTYGLLTFNPLPKLCDFPMFISAGEITTSIKVNFAVLPLDDEAFEVIKRFHYYVFDEVLDIAKKFLIYHGNVNCLYVVPVRRIDDDYDVDWELLQTYKPIPPVVIPTDAERQALRVTVEEYKYAVVTPYYRPNVRPDRYIVTNVLEYTTPMSWFESADIPTYADYYRTKYNLEILGSKDQPMLEVRNITTRANCLLPRAATIRSFTDKQRKLIAEAQGDKKFSGFPEMFVPEFCIKFDYPGAMWLKATLLPSIVHRVTMLLTADELRAQIQMEIGRGHVTLPPSEKWEPILVDIGVATRSLLADIEPPSTVMSVDRINNPIDEFAPRKLNIITMRESVYQLQKKKISKEYPWPEENEPVDIERNLSTVTVMDVEVYESFVGAPLISVASGADSAPLRPRVPPPAAILPPPTPKYHTPAIELLLKKPSPRGPELRDILTSLTTINSHDNFNLERTETLGDSFLKFAASLYLYHRFPAMDEGQLTNIKGRLIGNRNLYYAGDKINLGGRMKVEQFTPTNDFVIPGFFAPEFLIELIHREQLRPTLLISLNFSREEVLSGAIAPATSSELLDRILGSDCPNDKERVACVQNAMQCYVKAQAVSDKSIADCVESLVGTYLVSGGIESAVAVLEWLNVLPKEHNFMQYLHKKVPTLTSLGQVSVEDVERILNHGRGDVEKILGYKFNDPLYLLEALSHASYIRNRYTRSYERLEFLGDAILDFLITSHIYEISRDLNPGELTDLRSALVNNVTFASYVVKLGLHKYLCSQLNPALENSIMNFVEHQEQRNHEIIEDVLYLIAEADCNIAEYVEVPKVLSDIFESLVGAIYLDSGGDLLAVWGVIHRVMHREIDAFKRCIPKQPVRVLHENMHACAKFGDPKVSSSEIPKVMVPVTFSKDGRQHTVYGVGNNKQQAKRAAAKLALKLLS